jgi:hypothetical protein
MGLCALLLPALASAQTDPLQADFDGGQVVVYAAGDGAHFDLPGGGSLALPLPPKAELSALAGVSGGWVLAGSGIDRDGRRHLFLVGGDRDGVHPQPVPGAQEGLARLGAVPLVDGGRLAGIAWLEGDGGQALSVRASAWDGRAWGPVATVAAPGPGSQLALTGAVLADGSWLLAWSAFDGEDDEIVWSRRLGESWLPARRLSADNAVPDVTPALAAAGDGALIAWSRYDGNDYRLMLARWSGGEWRDEAVAGGAGSLYPRFIGGGDGPRLLSFAARAGGWAVHDFDARGRLVRRTLVTSKLRERPVALAGGEGEIRLRWPDRGRELAGRFRAVTP